MASLNLRDSFIWAGGETDDGRGFLGDVRRIWRTGRELALANLPTPKAYFALAYWPSKSQLITVGGQSGSYMKEANRLAVNIEGAEWSPLPDLLSAMSDRAACVVEPGLLFVFGGTPFADGQGTQVLDLESVEPAWRSLPLLHFDKRYSDTAIPFGNNILVFG